MKTGHYNLKVRRYMAFGSSRAAALVCVLGVIGLIGHAPGTAIACNAYTFTLAAPLNPLQAGVQRVVGVAVKATTGLSIIVKESATAEQHLDHYLNARSDIVVLTGSETKAFLDKGASLPGQRIEGKTSGITFIVHPDTVKLFPKMPDLLSRLMTTLEKAGRERLLGVTTDASAKRLVEEGR
jgi:hypothetical protein